MTVHYHGTPITPRSVLYELHGCNFCVTFTDPRDMEICRGIGQSVMIDNGAFGYSQRNKLQTAKRDWNSYYKFVADWHGPNTWAVIPDVNNGDEHENGLLIAEWYARFGNFKNAAPVWHLHESFEYLDRLVNGFERVCFGSSREYWQISSGTWNNRMNEVFNRICKGSGSPPCDVHMLRGMSLSGSIYPFASVDSTDIARNHEQNPGRARQMATKWDALQNPAVWQRAATAVTLDFEK